MKDNRLLFIFGCLPIRLGLVVCSAFLWNYWQFRIVATIIALIIAIGFLRSKTTKGFFGNPSYWPRTLHALTYFIFVSVLLTYPKYAWIPLLVDICIGIFVVSNYYNK